MMRLFENRRNGLYLPVFAILVCAACVIGSSPMHLAAQDPFGDAFGDEPGPDPVPGGDIVPADDINRKPDLDDGSLLETEDPVALAIRDSNPTTPAELIHAARVLFQAGNPPEARIYLKRFLDAKAKPETIAAVYQKEGNGIFLQFQKAPTLQPEGAAVADLVLNATHRLMNDRPRLDGLVATVLKGGGAAATARAALKKSGESAVAPLVAILADPTKKAQHDLNLP